MLPPPYYTASLYFEDRTCEVYDCKHVDERPGCIGINIPSSSFQTIIPICSLSLSLSLLVECSYFCLCNQKVNSGYHKSIRNCGKRFVQCGVRYPLEVFKTINKGWGVRTTVPIPKGRYKYMKGSFVWMPVVNVYFTYICFLSLPCFFFCSFVCEYMGEYLTAEESIQQEKERKKGDIGSFIFEKGNGHRNTADGGGGGGANGTNVLIQAEEERKVRRTAFINLQAGCFRVTKPFSIIDSLYCCSALASPCIERYHLS